MQISFSFQTSLFGEGTYLTSDLSMAFLYSPHGNGWCDSVLGPVLSCIALCEIIDHPDVKCQVKKKGNVSHIRNQVPSLIQLFRNGICYDNSFLLNETRSVSTTLWPVNAIHYQLAVVLTKV